MKILVLILAFYSSLQCFASPVLVAHKGSWKDMLFPQNTKESLVKALDNGFSALEFDVYMTRDNVFILAHDNGLEKVTNCKGKISDKNYEEIKNCVVLKNTLLPITKILVKKVKNPQRLTRLDELLLILNDYQQLEFVWIDLKQQDEKLVLPLKQTIEEFASTKLKSVLVVNNADASLLLKFKNSYPEVKYSLEGKWGSEPLVDDSFITNAGITHDIISVNVGFRLGDESPLKLIHKQKRFYKRLHKLLEKAKALNIQVVGWTVNRMSKIEKLLATKLDYLLTDRSLPLKD